jgi:hypothetical protein
MIIANGIGVPFSTGGGSAPVNLDFVFEVDTTKAGSASDTFIIPLLSGGTYSGTIHWGDDTTSVLSYANRSHTYSTGGVYTITIVGDTIAGFQFNNGGDKAKLLDVSNWGNLDITTNRAFYGCSNWDFTATDTPTISTTDMSYAFAGNASLTDPDFSSWDMSLVQSTYFMFQGASLFNTHSMENWDTSNFSDMGFMFYLAVVFNGRLTNWSTPNNTSLRSTWKQAYDFNQPIAQLGAGNVNTLQEGLSNATDFNQPLPSLSNITILFKALENCDAFDQDMGDYDIDQVSNFNNFMSSAAGLSTANYDATLIGWAAQIPLSFSGTLNFGGSKYTSGGAADAARTSLIADVGGITDGGAA